MKAKIDDWRKSRTGRFLENLIERFQASQLAMLAAALAFYAAFSLGPLLLLLAGGLGFLLQHRPQIAEPYREALAVMIAQIMPLQDEEARVQLVEQSLQSLMVLLQEGALLRSVISLIVLIWASTNFFASLQFALELIFRSAEPRGFWRKRLVAVLLVVLVAIVIFFELIGGLLVGYLTEFLAFLQRALDDQSPGVAIGPPEVGLGAGEIVRVAVTAAAFILCFRYLPRRSSSWVGAVAGGLFTTATLMLLRELLIATFNVERFNLVYGVITSLVFVLLWLYVALLLFLCGALIAAELSGRLRQEPPGARS